MKTTTTLKRGMAKIRRAWLARKFDRALRETDRLLEEWPDNPHLLVWWADLVQLQKTEAGPTIEDAKSAYRRAIELDPEAPEPLVGLGHYLNALEDNAHAANECFAKAVSLCRDWLRQTLLARAAVLTELGRPEEAFDCLAEARWLEKQRRKTTNLTSGKEIIGCLEALRRAE